MDWILDLAVRPVLAARCHAPRVAVDRLPACLIVLALATIGCRQGPVISTEPLDATQQHLLAIGRAYRQFQATNRRPPKEPAEIVPILKQFGAGEDVFRSNRDGEPLVICWGTQATLVPAEGPLLLLAYEQHGARESGMCSRCRGSRHWSPQKNLPRPRFRPASRGSPEPGQRRACFASMRYRCVSVRRNSACRPRPAKP